MGTLDLILDLALMSNIYQVQIHNLMLARQWVIEDQKPVPNSDINTGDLVLVKDHTSKTFIMLARQWVIEDQKPVPYSDINTGDLVLVKDHTSKTFMPKYKTDFHVIRVLGNKGGSQR